jgi:hypothetical protein
MVSRIAFLSILLALLAPRHYPAVALEQPAVTAATQKKRALELFLTDAKVKLEVKTLMERGYKLLSTDGIPYHFVYGEEGPITHFLVVAWFGKSEAYGWSPAFVMGKVNTDAFGPPTVTLIDSKKVRDLLRQWAEGL